MCESARTYILHSGYIRERCNTMHLALEYRMRNTRVFAVHGQFGSRNKMCVRVCVTQHKAYVCVQDKSTSAIVRNGRVPGVRAIEPPPSRNQGDICGARGRMGGTMEISYVQAHCNYIRISM